MKKHLAKGEALVRGIKLEPCSSLRRKLIEGEIS